MTMKNQTICGDGQMLVAYLYDECDANERVRVERHLESCDACVSELAELGSARQHLAMWAPPEAALGFRIVPERPAAIVPAPVAWWRQPLPAWGQAVAAMALFGLGMAAGSRPIVGGGPVATDTVRTATVSADALAQLEARMKQEIAALRAPQAAPVAVRTSAPSSDDAILRQVRELIRESEGRQEEAFTVRAAQLARDAEIQRRVDQAQMQQALTQMQGTTSEEVRRQREMLNYLVNVSQRR